MKTLDRLRDGEFRGSLDRTTIGRGAQLAGGLGLLAGSFRRQSTFVRLLMMAGAGVLIYGAVRNRGPLNRLLEGRTGRGGARPVKVEHSVTIGRPVEEVYAFWRNLENLPRFMSHLVAVEALDERRSRWRAQGPFGGTVEWDAEITRESPNDELGWRSLPGSQVDSAGVVRFMPALNGHGTLLQVEMKYSPPAGRLGTMIAKLLGRDAQTRIEDDLERLRQLLESGGTGVIGGDGQRVATDGQRSTAH